MIPSILALIAVALLLGGTLLVRPSVLDKVLLWQSPETLQSMAVAMRVIISIVVLSAGLYVILNHDFTDFDKKWGYGIVGTVVGDWNRLVMG